jgi:hypothetical protein
MEDCAKEIWEFPKKSITGLESSSGPSTIGIAPSTTSRPHSYEKIPIRKYYDVISHLQDQENHAIVDKTEPNEERKNQLPKKTLAQKATYKEKLKSKNKEARKDNLGKEHQEKVGSML